MGLQRFFGTFIGEPPQSVGAEFRIDLGGADDLAVGTVTACEPVRRIGYDWSWQGEETSRVEVTFTPAAGSTGPTTVRIEHRMGQAEHAAGYGGGWEQLQVALAVETGREQHDEADQQQVEAAAVAAWRQLLAEPD